MNEQAAQIKQGGAVEQAKQENFRLRHGLWAAGGFLFFALGMAGVVLPILPTTPFILVAAFCFARSSDRLNSWFKGTKVYKMVLEGYMTKHSMTLREAHHPRARYRASGCGLCHDGQRSRRPCDCRYRVGGAYRLFRVCREN